MLVLGHGKNLADYIRTGKVLSSPKVEIMKKKSKHSWFPPMVRGTYETLTSLNV